MDFDPVLSGDMVIDISIDNSGILYFQDFLPFFSPVELIPDSQNNKDQEFSQEDRDTIIFQWVDFYSR